MKQLSCLSRDLTENVANFDCLLDYSQEILLYPWDAGVDSGITYESPDTPTSPKEPITRITSRFFHNLNILNV